MAASGSKIDRQRDSNSLRGVEQLELRIPRRAVPQHVDVSVVAMQRSMTAAILLCVQASGLTDGEISSDLEIDPATWSRTKNGQANFPPDKLEHLMERCGNHVPLQYLAMRSEFELRPLRSALEVQLDDLRAQLADRDREIETIKRFVQETRR